MVNFGGPWNGKCRNILRPFGLFNGHFVSFMAVGIVCGHLAYFSRFLYVWTKKNLATLPQSHLAWLVM
jgi:hypothetical protein